MSYTIKENYEGCSGYALVDPDGKTIGCYDTRKQAELARGGGGEDTSDLDTNESNAVVSTEKQHTISEGDFVMGETAEGLVHGVVEHIMWEGGVLGEGDYAIQSMPPENPAMSVRVYEQDMDDNWVPTAYSIGMQYVDATVHDIEDHQMNGDDMADMEYVAKKSPCWKGYRQEGMKPGQNGGMVPNCVPVKKWLDAMEKAETYTPNDGMKAAARRALKWKEDGEAKGAGTAVGWGRARDIAAGRSMSASVVKRMYSFFSRHEKSSKGAEGFNSGEEGYPSNGRIMWDAWGGDAGFTWSRKIAEREADKALFSNFGKDLTNVERMTHIFKADSVRSGQMVSWNSSGGRARGKVKRVIRSGSYDVPDTDITINATEEDPAVVITLYRDGEPTDTIVAHRMSSLTVTS